MLECPHCSHQAMTTWAKAWLGPLRKRACDACGGLVGVPWRSLGMLLPLYTGLGLGWWLWPSWLAALPVALGTALMFVYHAQLTPLVMRE